MLEQPTSSLAGVRASLTINGEGAGVTIIDGNRLDRVFNIQSGTNTLSGLTIRNGLTCYHDPQRRVFDPGIG